MHRVFSAACVDDSDLTLGGLRLGAPISDAVAAYGPADHAGACMTANGGACTEALWADLGLNVVADGSGAIVTISLGVGNGEQSGISGPADLRIGMTHGEIIDLLGRRPGARNTMKRGYRFPQCREETTEAYLELGFDHEDWLNAITIAYDQIR